MLILPDGYKKFQEDIYKFTPGKFEGRKLRREVGYQPTSEPEKIESKRYVGWVLPKNFCPDCERTDITPKYGLDGTLRLNPGITELEQPMPEIDLTIGDVIWNWICHDCMDRENWGSVNIHGPTEKRVFFQAIHERREKNTIEWIKAARLRGEKPIEGRRSY